MKTLFKALGLVFGIAIPILAGPVPPPAGSYILNVSSIQAQPAFSVASGTVSGQLTVGSCSLIGGGSCGSGGGGSSSLAISAGISRSSPTSDAIFPSSQFVGSVSGSSMTVTLNASSVTLQGQNGIILNQNTLQSGSTFYTSSGTVQGQFTILSLAAGTNPSTSTITMTANNNSLGTPSKLTVIDTAGTGGLLVSVASTTVGGNLASIKLNSPLVSSEGVASLVSVNGIGFSSTTVLWPGGAAHWIGFAGSTATATTNPIWALPWQDGTNGQALLTDGSKNLYFGSVAGSGGSSTTTVQINGSTLSTAATSFNMIAGVGLTIVGSTPTVNAINLTYAADTAVMLSRATDQANTDKACFSTTGNTTYACALNPTLTAYTTGQCLTLIADTSNTTTASLNVNSLGALSILGPTGGSLSAGNITANDPVTVCLSTSTFKWIIQGGGSSGGGSFINNQNTLQAGATFYVSSGTANAFNANTVNVTSAYQYGGSNLLYINGTNTNLFLGLNAGNGSLSGTGNYSFGFGSLLSLTSGSNNEGFGSNALGATTSGSFNTAMGGLALFGNIGGSSNTAVGFSAGYNSGTSVPASAVQSIFLGTGAGTAKTNLTNGIAIGAGVIVSTDNTAEIGGLPNTSNAVNLIISTVSAGNETIFSASPSTGSFVVMSTASIPVLSVSNNVIGIAAGSYLLSISSAIGGPTTWVTDTLGNTVQTGSVSASSGTFSNSKSKYVLAVSSNAGGPYTVDVSSIGHVGFQGVSGATVTSCGTLPTLVGNDTAGTITTSGSVTGCTLTFGKAYTNTPVCTESDSSTSVTADISSISNTAVTFGFSSSLGSGKIYYICVGSD